MKKMIISLAIVLIFLSSLVSAGLVSGFLERITGRISYVPKCIDSDGGNNVFQRGKAVDGRNNEGIDYCSDGQLMEYYCDMNALEVKWEVKDCPAGHKCLNGVCKKKEERLKVSDLEDKNTILLVVGEELSFGFDSLVVSDVSGGEADITYTKKVRAKDGDIYVFGGTQFEVNIDGESVELLNKGVVTEVVEKEVEKVVFVDKPVVEVKKKPGFWARLFGSD